MVSIRLHCQIRKLFVEAPLAYTKPNAHLEASQIYSRVEEQRLNVTLKGVTMLSNRRQISTLLKYYVS